MRLLDARSFTLKTFVDDIPPYAILSHCWEDDEVVFADLDDLDAAKTKKGFLKIQRSCDQALQDGLKYVWIDTCCIDKNSSAELSEAINSMFAWYKHSNKCYAYLADVFGPLELSKSRWFERAWTLQELLAPPHWQPDKRIGFEFFSRDWRSMGGKASLGDIISARTGIPREYLEGKPLDSASISMKMSWAADRRATRAEDIAYSLLGLFDVNMPLLYGEGKQKAFRRLQEEIMKISEDETLFAWESMEFSTDGSVMDVLASDPKDFSESSGLVPFAPEDRVVPYTMTHRGLRIWLQLIVPDDSGRLPGAVRPLRSPIMIWSSQGLVWAILRCHMAYDFHHIVAIPLRHLSADMYVRDTSTNVALISSDTILDTSQTSIQEIYIRNSRVSSISSTIRRRFGYLIQRLPDEFSVVRALPFEYWEPRNKIVRSGSGLLAGNNSWHVSVALGMSITRQEDAAVKYELFICFGWKREHGEANPVPWCHVDSNIWSQGEGNLQVFHDSVAGKQPRQRVKQFRHGRDIWKDINVSVKITPRRVLGTDMFVVDIYWLKHTNLGVPDVVAKVQGSTREDGEQIHSPMRPLVMEHADV